MQQVGGMVQSIGFYEPPPTDRELTTAAVRDVVRDQFPELTVAIVERLGDGWEHEAYLVDGRVVFRFPRYADAGVDFEPEERIHALVASAVGPSVGIPRITRWGKPSARFPHRFAGHDVIPGLDASDPRAPRNPALAEDLGRALAHIHAIPADAANAAGVATSEGRETDWPAALRQVQGWVNQVPAIRSLAPEPCAWLEGAPLVPPPFRGPARFIHDDLQMEHVIVSPTTGRLSGIIDWGGRLGDPERDFSYVLLHGGWSFFQRAVAAYDLPLDEEFAERTLFSARLGALGWLADAVKRGGSMSRELPIVRRVFELE